MKKFISILMMAFVATFALISSLFGGIEKKEEISKPATQQHEQNTKKPTKTQEEKETQDPAPGEDQVPIEHRVPSENHHENDINKDGGYSVQPGDTLFAIAKKFDVSVEELRLWNLLRDPDRLTSGLELALTGLPLQEIEERAQEIKDYLLRTGKDGWSPRFLEATDIKLAYVGYRHLGNSPDLEGFAYFLSQSNGFLSFEAQNWEELAIQDIYEATGGFYVDGFELGENIGWEHNLMTAFIISDGVENNQRQPIVDINPITGQLWWNYGDFIGNLSSSWLENPQTNPLQTFETSETAAMILWLEEQFPLDGITYRVEASAATLLTLTPIDNAWEEAFLANEDGYYLHILAAAEVLLEEMQSRHATASVTAIYWQHPHGQLELLKNI